MTKTIALACLAFIAGCAAPPPETGSGGVLGEGRFEVSMPYLITNTTPVITIQNCGRIDITTVPYDTNSEWRTFVDWPRGGVSVEAFTPDGARLVDLWVRLDGTNVLLNVTKERLPTADYFIKKEPNGRLYLEPVTP